MQMNITELNPETIEQKRSFRLTFSLSLPRELEHARFWDADGKRKWAVLPYNSSLHHHIYNAKYLFSIMDD